MGNIIYGACERPRREMLILSEVSRSCFALHIVNFQHFLFLLLEVIEKRLFLDPERATMALDRIAPSIYQPVPIEPFCRASAQLNFEVGLWSLPAVTREMPTKALLDGARVYSEFERRLSKPSWL